MSSTKGARREVLAAALSGLLLAAAFPRFNLFPLAHLALVPLLLMPGSAGRARALLRGYACGLTFFLVLLYWIPRVMVVYGGLPAALAWLVLGLLVFYLATYVALFSLLLSAACRRLGPAALAAAPVVWVGLEWVRGHLLSGFPWGAIGYSQSRNLSILQWASWGGIDAVSALVVAANAGLALVVVPGASRKGRAAGWALLALVLSAQIAGRGLLRADSDGAAAPIRVAAVQGNVPQDRKWDPGQEARITSDLVRLTRQAAGRGARLVVWSESASPYSFRRPVRGTAPGGPAYEIEPHREYVDLVTGMSRDLGIGLVAGSVDYARRDGEIVALNSAFTIGRDGTLGPSYSKVHLVPFGEYVPLQRLLFFVNRMAGGAIAGFVSGENLDPLPTPAGPAATFICYEAIFPGLVRRLAGGGGALLVNITNDAWFGRSAAPEQHLAMAAVRAVENRRYLVRAANTGISAIIDPRGRIAAQSRLEEQTIVAGDIVPRDDRPAFAGGGGLFGIGCAILTAFLAMVIGSRTPGRTKAAAESAPARG